MTRHFDDDLSIFNNHILRIAAYAEKAIGQSIEALQKQDKVLARKVIEQDKEIDEMENKIEVEGIDLLARYQPVAVDLRRITNGLKINSELERIADMAVNVCYKVIDISDQPLLKPLVDIPKLADIAQKMLKGAIDAFVNRDAKLAEQVILSDESADKLRNQVMTELVNDYMVKDGKTAPRAVPLLLIARDLERICDHATNIAEDVIYMTKAKMVKHHPEELEGKTPKRP